MSFTTLPPVLGDALAARGYANPTPVQAAVLQDDARGRDLVVSAQTGSGKTVAFGMAMATELLGEDDMIAPRSEEHTSELQSQTLISYAVFAEQFGRHRHAERDGLARSGLRRDHQIAPARVLLKHGSLDRSGIGIAASGKGVAEDRRESGEGHGALYTGSRPVARTI